MADKLYEVTPSKDGYHFDTPEHQAEFVKLRTSLFGTACQLILRKKPQGRSLKQNAYIHAEIFPKMARFIGCSVARCKLDMLGHCFGWEYSAASEHYLPRKPSTADLKVQEMTDFIDWAPSWCQEFTNGVVFIVLPDEWYDANSW